MGVSIAAILRPGGAFAITRASTWRVCQLREASRQAQDELRSGAANLPASSVINNCMLTDRVATSRNNLTSNVDLTGTPAGCGLQIAPSGNAHPTSPQPPPTAGTPHQAQLGHARATPTPHRRGLQARATRPRPAPMEGKKSLGPHGFALPAANDGRPITRSAHQSLITCAGLAVASASVKPHLPNTAHQHGLEEI
jgi:hypothetical protein